MKKLLLLLGMCIILSSLALADANYTFTNATGTYYVNNYTTVGNATWTVPSDVSSVQVLVVNLK
jgi:ABC-type oligopeptide transport system substrate-binding subunit